MSQGILEGKLVRLEIREFKLNEELWGRLIMAIINFYKSDDWLYIGGLHGANYKQDDPAVKIPTYSYEIEKLNPTGEPMYCNHKYPSFLPWHTAYLREFEILLNRYDYATIKTNPLSLPFLDLTLDLGIDSLDFFCSETLNILYDGTYITVDNPLRSSPMLKLKNGVQNKTMTERNGFLVADNIIEKEIIDTLQYYLNQGYYTTNFDKYGSNTSHKSISGLFNQFTTLESLHNTLHGCIGGIKGTMGNLGIAAFDIIFWFHHCFIDYCFYNWLYYHTDKFIRKLLSTQISDHTLQIPLVPFYDNKSPEDWIFCWQNDTEQYLVADKMFEIEEFHYTYPVRLIEPNVYHHSYIEISDVAIPMESLNLFAYLIPSSHLLTNQNKDEYRAGFYHFFGLDRTVRECCNCNISFINISIDINKHVLKNFITKDNLKDYTLILEGVGQTTGKMYSQEDILKTTGKYIINLDWCDYLNDGKFDIHDIFNSKLANGFVNKFKELGHDLKEHTIDEFNKIKDFFT